MGTGKPLISILMAVYEPRMDWLKQQLESLEAQTYPNLRLYIRDDCSPTVPFEEIEGCVRDCIRSFPYEIKRNKENLGSNLTFERLTQEAEGAYFAYCDQDDVWLPEKLKVLEQLMTLDISLAYSDMSVIGESGQRLAESLCEFRPRLQYQKGKNLSETYFFQNCTAGCSMLIRAETAKQSLPFPQKTVCDQWLCIIGASRGGVAFSPQRLLCYRQHRNNQTGILSGVTDKEDYWRYQIEPLMERAEMLCHYKPLSPAAEEFIKARRDRKKWLIWKHRKLCRKDSWLELVIDVIPQPLFALLLKIIKNGGRRRSGTA